jgi:hypothetical protein
LSWSRSSSYTGDGWARWWRCVSTPCVPNYDANAVVYLELEHSCAVLAVRTKDRIPLIQFFGANLVQESEVNTPKSLARGLPGIAYLRNTRQCWTWCWYWRCWSWGNRCCGSDNSTFIRLGVIPRIHTGKTYRILHVAGCLHRHLFLVAVELVCMSL